MDHRSPERLPGLELPGRTIPVPTSISPEAQAALAVELVIPRAYPPIADHAGWRAQVAAFDGWIRALGEHMSAPPAQVRVATIAGVTVAHAVPDRRLFPAGKVILDIHGGSLIYLGGEAVPPAAAHMAARTGADVISIDYRMPPDHPYPAGLDDCVAVYRAVIGQYGAGNVIVCGASAGGNLAAALALRARDEGLDLPRALILLTPEVDLTETGDTFQTLNGVDRLAPLMPVNLLYANGAPLDHPYLSPLFGDFAKGFPPTFLQSGTRDLFLSNTVRMHRGLRKAGIEAELHVWEAMPHGAFNLVAPTPEDLERDEEVRRFLAKYWGGA